MPSNALACPWCGKPAKVVAHDGRLYALCGSDDDPGSGCPGAMFEVGVPLEEWNRRAAPPTTKMIVDDLRRAVRSGIGFPHHQIRFTEEEAANLFEEWPEAVGEGSDG